eukprot:1931808-Alexandrium_andersonii.AAC.1
MATGHLPANVAHAAAPHCSQLEHTPRQRGVLPVDGQNPRRPRGLLPRTKRLSRLRGKDSAASVAGSAAATAA